MKETLTTNFSKNLGKMSPRLLLQRRQTSAATRDVSLRIPKNLKTDLPYYLAVTLLEIYPKDLTSPSTQIYSTMPNYPLHNSMDTRQYKSHSDDECIMKM